MTNEIAPLLAAEIARRGITDTIAAEVLGVGTGTITRWTSGQSVPRPSAAPTLAAFLRLKVREVDRMLDAATPRAPAVPPVGVETLGVLFRALEDEQNVSAADMWVGAGIDKSRYYRLRADKAAPNLVDIPDLARRLRVDELRLLHAAYNTEKARLAAMRAEPVAPKRKARVK